MNELEEMSAFFIKRIDGYDEHMLNEIEGLREAYAALAGFLPSSAATLLDLGCGTGLELSPIYERFPEIKVTGIDLTESMLKKLDEKFRDKKPTLICGSYFDCDFGSMAFDAAVSFETLHHFAHELKLGLYNRLHAALKAGGVYVEADYVAPDEETENRLFAEYDRLSKMQGLNEGFYHFDTPCTAENQIKLLKSAGFSSAEVVWQFENTVIFVAKKF